MLTELRVRDLAVIADVTLPFQPGLNVLTGETGAGKSMVVDALALLLGERASADVVRPGADKTIVEGAFEFASAVHRHLLPPFAALGIELEDGRLILKREVHREGKSRAWVNGSPTTVGVLAQVGALLVDLHGQHETQSLLRPDAQRDMLDAYADADVERVAVRDAYARLKELEQREADQIGRAHVGARVGAPWAAAPQKGRERGGAGRPKKEEGGRGRGFYPGPPSPCFDVSS